MKILTLTCVCLIFSSSLIAEDMPQANEVTNSNLTIYDCAAKYSSESEGELIGTAKHTDLQIAANLSKRDILGKIKYRTAVSASDIIKASKAYCKSSVYEELL